MRNAAFILASLIAALAAAQVAMPDNDRGWRSPETGRSFNNPMSAAIDGQLLRLRQQHELCSNMLIREMFAEQWRTIGRKVIADGKATTALGPLDDAMARRAAALSLGKDAPADRVDAVARSIAADFAEVRTLASARGVALGDAGRLLALAVTLGYERYRGEATTPAQFDAIAAGFRRGLLADLVYQGQGQIAADLQAAKFASAIAALERVAAGNDAAATRAAGGALLASLWADPIESIEPAADGFIDRGRRIVRDRAGTTTFRRVLSDESLSREASSGLYFSGGLATSKEESDRNAEAARSAWIAERVGDVEALRRDIAAARLDADDLAACAAVCVARLWPLLDAEARSLTDAQRAAACRMFADDIRSDPAFQRLDDAGRQRVFDRWAATAKSAQRSMAAKVQAADLDREADAAKDAMEALVLRSQAGVARSEAEAGRSRGVALLRDLFAPRDLAKVELRADGFVVTP